MHAKKGKRILLAGYFVIILFCMFLGFGRVSRFDSYHMSFTIRRIPLWVPKHFSMDILSVWIFSVGNLVAFIPFGALIPWNYRPTRGLFLKSLMTFVVGITILEILQMLSLLGSFDAEDILVNTLGFLIGYASWVFGKAGKRPFYLVFRFCMAAILLSALAIIGAELLNPLLK